MPEIRNLATRPDGKTIRGYEVDFETRREDFNVYVLSDGTTVKVKGNMLKIYRIVDDEGNDSFDPSGDPEVFINSGILVVASKPKS